MLLINCGHPFFGNTLKKIFIFILFIELYFKKFHAEIGNKRQHVCEIIYLSFILLQHLSQSNFFKNY